MKKLFLAALAATVPAVASAQEAPAAPFTGVRAEAIAGYDSLGDGVDGVVYGGAIGFDAPVGALTLGIEGEFTDSSAKATEVGLVVAGDRTRISAGRDLYVGGRVGFPLSPTALLYAKGGYTNARFNARYTSGATSIREHADADGFRLGTGLEFQVNPNIYLKGEYRYSNYKSVDNVDIDADRHQVVGGVGFRF